MRRALRSALWAWLTLALASPALDATDVKALRAVAAETSAILEEAGYVAKVPLARMSNRYVLPDGSPSDEKGKKQGYIPGGGSAIEWDDGIKVRSAETGYGVWIYVKKDKLMVTLNKKKGARLNPAWVHIFFDRPITAADLTPEAIADALDSVVVFHGYDPASRMAAAFDEGLADAPADQPGAPAAPQTPAAPPPPVPPATPTVLSVRVSADPLSVRPGGEVKLLLEYEVATPEASSVAVETRRLTFAGELIPSYPVAVEIARPAGRHISSYSQPLPASVSPGIYTYEGEVCVAGDCIRRSVTFEVVP